MRDAAGRRESCGSQVVESVYKLIAIFPADLFLFVYQGREKTPDFLLEGNADIFLTVTSSLFGAACDE